MKPREQAREAVAKAFLDFLPPEDSDSAADAASDVWNRRVDAHLAVIERRLEGIYHHLYHEEIDGAKFAYDQVSRAISKMREELLDAAE